MSKRSSRVGKRNDIQEAMRVVEAALGSSQGKNPAGRQGEHNEGSARALVLTAEQKKALTQLAVGKSRGLAKEK
jgi:hypothetical protein